MIAVISICLITSYRLIDPVLHRSTITLLIFNILLVPIFFQLGGTTFKKIFMITAGNLVGLFSNIIFYYFSFFGGLHFGTTFNSFLSWIYPFFNLMWIVPFWALSLGFLLNPARAIGKETNN